jgi:hypothetical protein
VLVKKKAEWRTPVFCGRLRLKLTLALCKLPHDAKLFLEKSENDEFREGALLPVSNVKRSRCRARLGCSDLGRRNV